MPRFPTPEISFTESDSDSEPEWGGGPMFGMVPPDDEYTSESEGSLSADAQIVLTQHPPEDSELFHDGIGYAQESPEPVPDQVGSPLPAHEEVVVQFPPGDLLVPVETALTQLIQYAPEPPQTTEEIAHIVAEIDQLETMVVTGFHGLRQDVEELRDELHHARTEVAFRRQESQELRAELTLEQDRVGVFREEAEHYEGLYREALQESAQLREQIGADGRRLTAFDRLWDIQMELFGRMERRTQTQAATVAEQAQRIEIQAATIAEQRQQIETQAGIIDEQEQQGDAYWDTIAELRAQVQTLEQRLEHGMRTMRRSYRYFEHEEYVPEAPYAPSSSDSSRPKRPRHYHPLEGSSAGPTDTVHSSDDDSGGATSGGSVGGPAVAEP